jgi:hypothetical protein
VVVDFVRPASGESFGSTGVSLEQATIAAAAKMAMM